MKIGVIFTAYNCENYLQDCLNPWLELREELGLILTANSGMFKPYKDFGFEEKNEKTLEILVKSKLDFLVTTSGNNLLDEDSSRNFCLDYLKKHKVDIVWVVDADEIYEQRDIKSIIEFIKQNQDTDAYKVQFRNYTFEYPYFTKGFSRETIYWTDRKGGVSHFHFDVFMEYNDGETINDTKNFIPIPKHWAYIEHYSWLNSDSRSHEKIVYQNQRFYGNEGERCAFISDGKRMKFNDKFWIAREIELPNLFISHQPYTFDLDLSYSHTDNCIYIDWVTREMSINMKIYDIEENFISSIDLDLIPSIRYFVMPDSYRNFSNEDNFKGFTVEVSEKNNLIHKEQIFIKGY